MLFKEKWICELIKNQERKILGRMSFPGIVLPHSKYSVSQLFVLGYRYFKINTMAELISLMSISINYKEIVFIDMENIELGDIENIFVKDKTIMDKVLTQKDIGTYNYNSV